MPSRKHCSVLSRLEQSGALLRREQSGDVQQHLLIHGLHAALQFALSGEVGFQFAAG